jgi:hypothetical protein
MTYMKAQAVVRQLPELEKKLRELERQIESFTRAANNKNH